MEPQMDNAQANKVKELESEVDALYRVIAQLRKQLKQAQEEAR